MNDQLPIPPSQFIQPTDVVSTIEELSRLDLEYEKWSGREQELHHQLTEEFSELHKHLYGKDILQKSLQDLLSRIDDYRQNLGNLSSLSARTEGINKQMIKSRREKEEQRREKIRQESLVKLKRSRNTLKEIVTDLVITTRACLSELATLKSQKLLTSIHSETSLNEIIDQTKLIKICSNDNFGAIPLPPKTQTKQVIGQGGRSTQNVQTEKNLLKLSGELLSLVVTFQELIREIASAKAVCAGNTQAGFDPDDDDDIPMASQSWLEELELFEDVDDDTEGIIKESYMICKILIVKRFELILAPSGPIQRIPRDLIQLFSQTKNFPTLVKLVTNSTPPKVESRPVLSLEGHQANYYYDQMLEVTNLFKKDIDRYYHIIYGSQESTCQPSESWLVFERLLANRQDHASAVYSKFHQELFNNLRLEQLTVKDLHPWLHECLLISSNALSIQKSIRKIVGKIDENKTAPSWLDIHEIRADLIKLVSVYLHKAWESARAMDDCGIVINPLEPQQIVSAQQNGSTMVDDIFYVIKEVTQQLVNLRDGDILSTYKSLVENILQDIPTTLETNAQTAMEIYLTAFFKLPAPSSQAGKSSETFFTPLTVRDLMAKIPPNSTPPSSPLSKTSPSTITSAQSFPHSVHSLKAILTYAAQVQEQMRSPPNTPSVTSSPCASPNLELCVVAENANPFKLTDYYQKTYDQVCSKFVQRLHDHMFSKIWVAPISDSTESAVVDRLNALHRHFSNIWPTEISNEIILNVMKCVLKSLERYLIHRAEEPTCPAQVSARESFRESAVSVLGGVFTGGSKSNELAKASEGAAPNSTEPNAPTGPCIDFTEALAIDALVRHLLEWADENLTGLEVREHFQDLLEICELITVDAVTDILDLSTSTQWHLQEDVAIQLLKARKDMQRYSQLDHVLGLLVTSGVFKKSSSPAS